MTDNSQRPARAVLAKWALRPTLCASRRRLCRSVWAQRAPRPAPQAARWTGGRERTEVGTRRLRMRTSQMRCAKLSSPTERRAAELRKMLPMSVLMNRPARTGPGSPCAQRKRRCCSACHGPAGLGPPWRAVCQLMQDSTAQASFSLTLAALALATGQHAALHVGSDGGGQVPPSLRLLVLMHRRTVGLHEVDDLVADVHGVLVPRHLAPDCGLRHTGCASDALPSKLQLHRSSVSGAMPGPRG